MKFPTKEDVTDDVRARRTRHLPNWRRTRYVEWTSWAAGSHHLAQRRRRLLDPGGELRAWASTRTS